MTKQEYMDSLRRHLEAFNQDMLEEIMSDYEEHFREGMENGKTEEEVIEELGDIEDLVQELRQLYPELVKPAAPNVPPKAPSQQRPNFELQKTCTNAVIFADEGEIQVLPSTDGNFSCDYVLEGDTSRKYFFKETFRNGTYYATLKREKKNNSAFNWGNPKVALIVHVPDSFGSLEFSTVSGRLRSNDITCQKINGHSVSGSVFINNCCCPDAEGSSVSGSVHLEGGDLPHIHGHSVSGSVHLEAKDPESIKGHSVSGSVHITLRNQEKGYRAEMSTVSGSIRLTHGDEVIRGKIHSYTRGQGKCHITASTVSGSIRINQG